MDMDGYFSYENKKFLIRIFLTKSAKYFELGKFTEGYKNYKSRWKKGNNKKR